METAAIIAEFNPFHNGHAYLLKEAGRLIGPQGARVIIMSGSFTQRGEPAILDKWTRTHTALDCGADLVIELPFAFAASSAGRFSAGGVAVAAATGVCRHLVFGSETDNLDLLRDTAAVLADEPELFRHQLHERLDRGEPFAGARIGALQDFLQQQTYPSQADPSCLRTSNSILAIEYLIAMQRQNTAMKPHVVLRSGQDYRSEVLGSGIASATALRKTISTHSDSAARLAAQLRAYMPVAALAHTLSALQAGNGPVFPDHLAAQILGRLRAGDSEDLQTIAGMGEGLSSRMAKAAARLSVSFHDDAGSEEAGLLDTWMKAVSTRRFAGTRIRRATAALLTGMTEQDLALFESPPSGPRYIRVLGFNRKGRYLLKIMRKTATLPIIMNGSDFLEYGQDPVLTRMAALDRIATDCWMLAVGKPCGMDFDTPPVMV